MLRCTLIDVSRGPGRGGALGEDRWIEAKTAGPR
jgi:hypothetical protein